MSDEINTQHGIIGLLMAEVEQLRRDLGNAKHDLGLWADEFDKQWPKDVKMTIANLRADLAQAKENNPKCETCGAELSECGKPNPDGTPSMDCKECQLSTALSDARYDLAEAKAENLELYKKWVGLRQSLTESKAENARLTSDNAQLREKLNLWILGDNSALEDLLAPTIELLKRLQFGCVTAQDTEKELSRLRSILTSSAKSDTNTP